MTVTSNMILFSAIGTVLRLLVVFQLAGAGTTWTDGIKIHSKVSSGGKPSHSNSDGSKEFAARPHIAFNSPNHLDASNSDQLQRDSPQSANVHPELPSNEFYQANRTAILPLPLSLNYAFPNAVQFQEEMVQQQSQQIFWQNNPYGIFQQPVPFRQVPQQVYQWTPWSQQRLPVPYQPPQYPHFTQPQGLGPSYRHHPPQSPQQPGPVPDDFHMGYGNPSWTTHVANQLMGKVEELIQAIRPIDRPLPHYVRFQLFQLAARLLSRMVSVEVTLISQRTNSEMDTRVDDLLHNIEDKSYQLRTMLIEMQSLGADNILVATPP